MGVSARAEARVASSNDTLAAARADADGARGLAMGARGLAGLAAAAAVAITMRRKIASPPGEQAVAKPRMAPVVIPDITADKPAEGPGTPPQPPSA